MNDEPLTEADKIAADFSTIPFENHEARTLALAYFTYRGEARNLLERVRELEAELAAALERIEQLEEGAWPWEWVVATRERERWKAAEAREAKLLEQIAYVEGVLSREPFGKADQDLAARILRAALREMPTDLFRSIRKAGAALTEGEG